MPAGCCPNPGLETPGTAQLGLFVILCICMGRIWGKPRCTTLSRTGANPRSRGGRGAPSPNRSRHSSNSFSLHRQERLPGGSLSTPEFGVSLPQGGCCSRGSPAAAWPSQVCSVAVDGLSWKRHLLGLSPSGGSRTSAASTSYHLFLIGFSGTRCLCLHEGPRAAVSTQLPATLGQEGTTHASPGSGPCGSSEQVPLMGRVNTVG